MKTIDMNTIDSNVSKFIAAYADKLWNRMVSGEGFNQPLRYSLQNVNGFIVAFDMMFDREPSEIERDFFTFHLYEREHVYLSAKGSTALGSSYHADMPNGYLVKMRAKFGGVALSVPAWGNRPVWDASKPNCWRNVAS